MRDKKEKKGHGWFWNSGSLFDGTTIAHLKQGDYTLDGYEEFIMIERKGGIAEWATNVVEERFERELERLCVVKYVWILLEFDMDNILNYPVGSGIPKKKWPKIRVRGPLIIKRMIEMEHKYPNINIMLCGENGYMIASSIFRRAIENIELYG